MFGNFEFHRKTIPRLPERVWNVKKTSRHIVHLENSVGNKLKN